MPRSPEIDRFAEKLGIVLDRLSLSRVQLAQLAGVDKSVAGRWASGRTRPGEQSIVRLTAIVRRQVPDFSRGEWHLPSPEFAARLGLPHRSTGVNAAELPQSVLGQALAEAARRYSGLWLLTHASFTGLCHIYAFLAELRAEPAGLVFEMADSAGYRARGTAFTADGKLCLVAEATSHEHWPCFFVFNGVELWRAMVLDGIVLSWGRDVSRAPVALRTLGFRLAPDEPDSEAAQRRFAAALVVLGRYYHDDLLQHVLPSWIAAELLEMARDPSSGALRVAMEQSRTIDETTLNLAEPADGPRRTALRAAHDLFQEVLGG
jgi:transcriptional regulator with XRE-family HTH domain